MHEESNKRLLFLPPGVQKGKERELNCDDFVSFDSKPLGQGAFGEVFRVKHKISGKDFAIKVISKRKIIERRMLRQIRREIRIMYSLNHPNIVSIYSHFEDVNNFYLILELAEGGQLYSKLKKYKTLNEPDVAQYLREVSCAVQYLHSRIPPVIHRDIKPENILLDAEGRAKLGDFGWSNFYDEERETYCGTLEYLAPEMISRKGHGVSLDVWSLGVLLFELLAGYSPFKARSQQEIFENIKNAKIVFPKSFPFLAKDLVKRMLQVDPERRITVEMILDHSWILSHAPLRPTAELVTVKVELPNVPDDGDVDFNDVNYCVISAPKIVMDEVQTMQPKLAFTPKTPASPKQTGLVSKTNLEITLRQEDVKRLLAKIEKLKNATSEMDSRIKEMKATATQQTEAEKKIEVVKKRINEIKYKNQLTYKRFINKIAEVKVLRKKGKMIERKLSRVKSDLRLRELKHGLLVSSSNYFAKLNCFAMHKNILDQIAYGIFLLKRSVNLKQYLPLAEKHLKSINLTINKSSEIEQYIPEFKQLFSQKSQSLKSLTQKFKSLKSATHLQSQIIKTIRNK